jgi:5-deoxy-glucuronate isomerase
VNRANESIQSNLPGFNFLKLANAEEFAGNSANFEIMAVVLGGKCSVAAGEMVFENIGKRPNVFGGKPYAVYIPANTVFRVLAPKAGTVEVALCYAKIKADAPQPYPFLVTPEQVESGVWGRLISVVLFIRFW